MIEKTVPHLLRYDYASKKRKKRTRVWVNSEESLFPTAEASKDSSPEPILEFSEICGSTAVPIFRAASVRHWHNVASEVETDGRRHLRSAEVVDWVKIFQMQHLV